MTTGGAVRKTSLRASIIAGALLLLSGGAHAAGLGKLTVQTHLGEPLRAEIDVVAVEKGELDTLSARLASPDAYVQSNLPYPSPALGLRLSVEQRSSGEPFIRVTSQQPIPEPFVDLLIELNWTGGKILRAYTALLDPPAFATAPSESSAPAPTREAAPPPPAPEPQVETKMGSEMQQAAPPAPPAETAAAEPAPSAETTPPAEAAAAPAKPAEPAPAEAGMPAKPAPARAAKEENTYGPVKRGDTLSKIAKEYKPDDVTLEQMLVLLYRNNKEAFAGKNMNRLKTGKVLSIPDPSEASGIPAKEARKEVRLQVADFNAYRERLAGAAGEATPAPGEPAKAAGGKVTGPIADKGAPAAGEPKEVLKLSKGEAPGAGGSKAMQDKVHGLEEEVAARDKTIREANERIAKLEKTVKDMQTVIDLKSKPMADLQKPAITPPTPAPAKPAPPPLPAAKPGPPVATAPTTMPSVTPPAAKPEPPPVTAAAPPHPTEPAPHPGPMAGATTPPGPDGAQPQPKPKPKPKVAPPPPPPPGLMDDLLSDPIYLAAGGGVIALVVGFLAYRVIKSRRGGGDDEVGAEKKTSEVRAFAATGTDTSGAMAAAARAAQAQVTEEVDPLAEAEIYLAYGRDGQAEEILKEAIQTQPRRFEVYLKLLEIYAKRKEVAAFDPLARDLQQATGGQGEVWEQAARLGYQLDPQNPRYAAGKPSGESVAMAAATAAAAATAVGGTDKTLDFQIDSLEPSPEIGTLTDIDAGFGRRFATTTAATSSERLDLNISLDDGQAPGTKTDIDLGRLSTAAESSGMDLDLDSLGNTASPGTSTDIDLGTIGSAEASAPIPAMDFSLDLPVDEKTQSEMAKVDSSDFDLKLDDLGTASAGQDAGLDFDINQISLEAEGATKAE
ncbi:MAG TPA: FimV/HubP family polar landmark protein, partial [Burkholderiales bacterium]|nr:FimV/HubP family polar landmark protein [Burkholderiales bacterium]